MNEAYLHDWREDALSFEKTLNSIALGLAPAIRLLVVSIFTRGHVLLEGNVGVGKTTLLRAAARGLGGAYQRVEGTIDLMPHDLIYYTHVDRDGRPRVDAGPLTANGDSLSVFFFNEINRARPQVHSLLLRVMAERSLTAFNAEHRLPYVQVFADRNRVEKEETFELPGAARDRFLMEIMIEPSEDEAMHESLMFDSRFHDTDELIEKVPEGALDYRELPAVARAIQEAVHASAAVRRFANHLRRATHRPTDYGIALDDVEMDELILAGTGPRGMSMLVRAAKVSAWLDGRLNLTPEDLRAVFREVIAHRVFLTPIYELQRSRI
ncbi:MAG: AAA family ATPase, partial [Burkholderiales bacterium]